MSTAAIRFRWVRVMRWLMVASSGTMLGVAGCDNVQVQAAILGGLQDLAGSLLDAFFILITPTASNTTPVTVDAVQQVFGMLVG